MYARVSVGRTFQTSLKVEEEGAATLTFTSNPKTNSAHPEMAKSKEIQEFRAKVDKNQRDLRDQLHQRVREAKQVQSSRHDDASALLQDVFNPSSSIAHPPNGNRLSYPGTSIDRSATYASANEVVKSSEDLLNEYGRIEKLIEDSKCGDEQPMADSWQQEAKDMERQLELGRKKAIRDVKKTLGADYDGERGLEHPEGPDGAEENIGGKENDTLDYELLKTLRYAERGVKRMVKGLPKDDAIDK
ncbi:hypothetical protein K491DRAFT_697782 [Lophiostoma macrostomum CBS 122681]|uniref:Uncharacterized protein n=1 Tax=Lophiostoma macrostomum CBS 122681 TaxID=1314788 RepID=A0A6A6SQN3_9PLEO|nr:hypothetical protein K491DRAFT_697782 [Lophiostoma macrostomum CBS 122681]